MGLRSLEFEDTKTTPGPRHMHSTTPEDQQPPAPILGDTIYPTILAEDAEDYSRPMHLTSTELEFIDPLTGRPRLFTGAVIR
ncbi:hypothetical protein Q6D62_09350 [Corynebacterium diphtheriae]|uniref:hypothetical protein n=2 Tax=Corynebacterium diphtheriae TaxID=1717 RepID=UPI0002468EB2|nr:hypothetical protein [Corynebacterium diphtheriae]AEX70506.1 hypothetical protein CDPW8_1858 [Corynebacterium diphtheriae PW8]APM35982.1 hypothetical protein BS112_05205 [Corynebacterium diphtheriae]MBG9341533.1 hypothetical protein [Corynebacterium diphtheriae]MBG9372395.1 hypothetical protein [Corynebacterium diphtheriae bv. mitis]MDZ5310013.1 hypothetical protein [Corynebacterium diphtheriae]